MRAWEVQPMTRCAASRCASGKGGRRLAAASSSAALSFGLRTAWNCLATSLSFIPPSSWTCGNVALALVSGYERALTVSQLVSSRSSKGHPHLRKGLGRDHCTLLMR